MECKQCKFKDDCVNVGKFKKGDCLQFEKLGTPACPVLAERNTVNSRIPPENVVNK